MERHKTTRRNQAQADEGRLLQSLLSQGLNQNDGQLLYTMLTQPAQTPLVVMCPAQPPARHRQNARIGLRTTSAALLVGGALALAAGNTALFTPTVQAQPAALVAAVADRAAADARASGGDTVLLRALLSSNTVSPRADKLKDIRLVAMRSQQVADRALAQLDNVDVIRADQIAAARELAMHKQHADATAVVADAQLADATAMAANAQFATAQLAVGQTLAIPAASNDATITNIANQQIATTYIVQPGDTLWDIAARYYGNGTLWWSIFQANPGKISNPDLIYPGQAFTLPTGVVGGVTNLGTLTASPILPAIVGSPYTVVSGDNLSTIALRAYGNGTRWPAIFAANPQIWNPNLIYPGWVLTIPR